MATLECVRDLEENDKDIRDDAVKTLLRITSNILKSPKEIKFRSLKVSLTYSCVVDVHVVVIYREIHRSLLD